MTDKSWTADIINRFMEVVRERWNYEDCQFDAIEQALSDPECFAALRPDVAGDAQAATSPDLDLKAVRKACDDWCWQKSGDPVGLMTPQSAAYQAFGAGAQYGFDVARARGDAAQPPKEDK